MKQAFALLLLLSAAAVLASVGARPTVAGSGPPTAKVVRVIAGDTVDVRHGSGRVERVRIVGIDAPDRGECFHPQATALTRRLALRGRAWIVGDSVAESRDRLGRRLAYVDTVYWGDLGARLLERGHAAMHIPGAPLDRYSWYAWIERQAYRRGVGLWGRACSRGPASTDLAVSLRRLEVPPAETGVAVAVEATVGNAGPVPATRVLVSVTPFGGLRAVSVPSFCRAPGCYLGTLSPGETRVVRVGLAFGASGSQPPSVTGAPHPWARAEVTSTTLDPNGANDSAALFR